MQQQPFDDFSQYTKLSRLKYRPDVVIGNSDDLEIKLGAFMKNLDILKNTLAECAEVPDSLLDKIQYDSNDSSLLYDVLFPLLGWDADNGYARFADGQFMEYMEWKEPYIDFDKFFIIKKHQLTIDTDDMFDDYEEAVGDEDGFDEMDFYDNYDSNRQYVLNYFNKKLAPHNLRFVELGLQDNAYFLLVHNDEQKIQKLIDAFDKFNIPVIVE